MNEFLFDRVGPNSAIANVFKEHSLSKFDNDIETLFKKVFNAEVVIKDMNDGSHRYYYHSVLFKNEQDLIIFKLKYM